MKLKMTTILCLLSATALAGLNLPKAYQEYSTARRYVVSRDTKTLDGYIITTWYRDGRPDWILPAVETNRVKHIQGKTQNNPIQNELEKTAQTARELFVAYTNQLASTTAYSNAYFIAQCVANAATAKIQDEIADLEAKIVKYKEYQTKYPILKSLFAAMITDAENRIKILRALTVDNQ